MMTAEEEKIELARALDRARADQLKRRIALRIFEQSGFAHAIQTVREWTPTEETSS